MDSSSYQLMLPIQIVCFSQSLEKLQIWLAYFQLKGNKHASYHLSDRRARNSNGTGLLYML